MTGKAYTMNEMRRIVEYVVEHRAYGEVKGRKMWMDYANSNLTNRTWQSLKETFLKRILPDIQNPYYKLTMHQIASLKEGQDIEKKLNNKLEVREANNISNGNTKNDTLSSQNENTEGENKGEDHTNSKRDRDSTDTIVLNNCYETVEDIKRDLMTPDDELRDTTKTLRDLIEFEPMTPDVQRMIDDFASEDEGSDGEPRMQIDLEERGKTENAVDEPISLSDTDETNIDKTNNAGKQPEKELASRPDNNTENTEDAEVEKADSSTKDLEKDAHNVTATEKDNKENSKTVLNNSDSIITSIHSTMPDSILPNNQEELNNKEKTNKKSLSLNKNDKNLKSTSNDTEEKQLPAKRKNGSRTHSVSSINSEKRDRQAKKSKANEEKVPSILETEQVSKEQDESNNQENESAQSQNPCLQSVNLYNETVAEDKHSETDDTIKLVNQPSTSKEVDTSKKNDVVVLKSHSESGSSLSEPERRKLCLIDSKRYKENTLANVFGYKSGSMRRRRSIGHRKRSISQRTYDISSGSSDWTSECGSEYVSPPRGRRNRHAKKYLKPKSSRVRSLEKNGGLFVVYNNRIYPLVKDGKHVKNHLNYVSDDESDADRKVWRRKYMEEKKRTEELERLLKRMEENSRVEKRVSEMAVCSSKCNAKTNREQQPPQDTNYKDEEMKQESVKIKFTKNNEEVQLEGPISHITPALAQVMQLLQKSDNRPSPKVEPERENTPSVVAVSIDDVQEKVDKLEGEIFKEIEEQDKNESVADNTEDQSSDGNVTKRAALRRRALSSTSVSPRGATKKPRVDKEAKSQKKKDMTPQKDKVRETRSSRTPRNVANEISKAESNASKRSIRDKTEMPEKTEIYTTQATDDSDIKYKFPSPPPTDKKSQVRNYKKSQQKKSNRYSKTETIRCNVSYSSESMQSYQDSDMSPPKVIVRVKPGCSTSKTQNDTHKSVSTKFINEDTESSSSFPDVKQTLTFHNSTLSEAYKSDSYQLLMPINSKTEKRSESVKRDMCYASKFTTRSTIENEDGQSSINISPPTSPVLSIVENLSINRSLMTSIDELQTDEMEQLESNHITLNKLMKSDEKSPKPLMEQDCRFDSDHNDGVNFHYNIQVKNNTLTPNSQSLVKKLNTISLRDFNVTDSVYVRLEKLMLDSTKKVKQTKDMEKENIAKVEEKKKTEKGKTKKRSSTPRRKENTRNTKQSKEPIIEEEHVERNSCVSRNSCPAMLQNTETISTEEVNKTLEKKPRTSKELKKLNIIKVKITKPKDKTKEQSKTDKPNTSQSEMNSTKTSSQTDNSIDLIHNHSETCLQAHECIDNSVEIVEKSSTIISVESEKSDSVSIFNIDEFLAEEIYSSNARDGIEESPETNQLTAECPDLYYTPLGPLSSANSLMTEDLSIDIPAKTPTPSTKWFLLSEDEATTNFDFNQNVLPKDVGYGANLNDLFPVTCAVPDLSTITEMSKENDPDTRSNLNVTLPTS